MEVQQEIKENKGRFFIEVDNTQAAEMTYSQAGPDKFIIDHTEVDEQFRGKNFGMNLLKAAVAYARTNKMKIMPLCPFAKKMMDQHEELNDVRW